MEINLDIPKIFEGFFDGEARYRVAYGGRGSAKSWTFATMLVIKACEKKRRILCCRELQKSIKDSSHRIISETISRLGLSSQFEVGESFIRHKNGSDFIFKGLKHNPDEIKSTEGIDIAWIEEAHRTTQNSFKILTPTVRKENSEIWITLNPDDEEDIIYQNFILNTPPPKSKILKVNYYDNPFFPKVLNEERLHDKNTLPEYEYMHIWEGEIQKAKEGSYYAKQLAELKEQNYITHIPYNSSFPVMTYWDIGMSDYTSIWFVQKIGFQYRVIDFYQNNNEDLEHYAGVIKEKKYIYSTHYLPFDADHLRLGMSGKTVAQQLANMITDEILTVEASRNINNDINNTRSFLRRCAFDIEKCEEGLRALRKYSKEWDDKRNMFKDKPRHDEHSHAADAFRYLAVHNININDIASSYDYNSLGKVSHKTIQMETNFEANDYL